MKLWGVSTMDLGENMTIDDFRRHYDVSISKIQVKGKEFQFYLPATIDGFIDKEDIMKDFPLWAKIWEPSVVLAHELSHMSPEGAGNILEIGCGVGVAGIVGAYFGHNITMTEYDTHALNFARANAILNLGSYRNIRIIRLDWRSPSLRDKFNIIIGSEIIYREEDFLYILTLLKNHLNPQGRLILTSGIRKTIFNFLEQLKRYFNVKVKKITLRSSQKEVPLLIIYGFLDLS